MAHRERVSYLVMDVPYGLIKRKLAEYKEIKRQIKEIANEAEKDESIDLLSNGTLKQLIRIH